MPTLEYTLDVDTPVEKVWEFYSSVESLLKVTPPTTKVKLEGAPGEMYEGARFTLIVQQPPIFVPLRWETIITTYSPPRLFVDEQGRGPFAYWKHEHHFDPLSNGGTRLRDVVTYRAPFGPLGTIANFLFIRRQLDSMFAYRHEVTLRELAKMTEK